MKSSQDDVLGMAWWNSLTDQERRIEMYHTIAKLLKAGVYRTATAKDCWECHKNG